MAENETVKQGMMTKRAIGKSSFGRRNWKDRFFVLTPKDLTYWEKYGGPSNPESRRCGGLLLADVKSVEPVAESAVQGRANVFSIGYSDYSLFCQCKDADERTSWVEAIRAQLPSNGAFNSGGSLRRPTDPLPSINGENAAQNGQSDGSHRPLPPVPDGGAQPADEGGFEVVVSYSFEAREDTDLSIVKGERLTIIEQTQLHWWKARNTRGQVGFIPSNYVCKLGMESEPWFRGKISRAEATAVLRMAKLDGCFLVRESESKPGQYSLSVSHKEGFRHYHVRHENGEYFISDRHRFGDICQLIEYHMHNSGGLITRLRKPIADLNKPVSAGLGHDKWEIDPNDITLAEELGSGQFGVVMKGWYKGNTPVAIKMMKEGTMSEDDFVSEAKVMQQFHHKNLVELYGVCTQAPLRIVTEFMSNGCLLNYIRDHQELAQTPEVIHFMSVQVASAMCYLEANLFIHRDLAARNCLIGDNNIVKVADFGLARFTLDDEYTASEGTKFPIKWAAPEVFNYARFSTKSDVWAYGILLWELWSLGITPYPSMSNANVIDQVGRGYRMDKPRYASEHVFSIMKDCWHQDPEYRPMFADIQKRLEENKPDYS